MSNTEMNIMMNKSNSNTDFKICKRLLNLHTCTPVFHYIKNKQTHYYKEVSYSWITKIITAMFGYIAASTVYRADMQQHSSPPPRLGFKNLPSWWSPMWRSAHTVSRGNAFGRISSNPAETSRFYADGHNNIAHDNTPPCIHVPLHADRKKKRLTSISVQHLLFISAPSECRWTGSLKSWYATEKELSDFRCD